MTNYIITFKQNTNNTDAKQFLVDNDVEVSQFIDRANIAFISATDDQYRILLNSAYVEAVEVNEEKFVLPPKSIDQPMDLTRIKKELNKFQIGQKPDWRDSSKMRDVEDSGINLLKYENLSFKVGNYTFEYEEDFGGEGKGDNYWVVFSVSTPGELKRCFKVPGWYASHHGGELEVENTFEVKPVEKTITVWTEVK